jgi:hypothetical protein
MLFAKASLEINIVAALTQETVSSEFVVALVIGRGVYKTLKRLSPA